ncbi:MAG: SPOR domain-containing protein [Deltaproteobacteria bacterium]|nr:SPOR domain-containing protein [Deltaproteobacteria bacterium]
MSWKENFTGTKSIPVIIGAIAAFLIAVYLFSFANRSSKDSLPPAPEVISKRVKIDLREEAKTGAPAPDRFNQGQAPSEAGPVKAVDSIPAKEKPGVKTSGLPGATAKPVEVKPREEAPDVLPAKVLKEADGSKTTVKSAQAVKKDEPKKISSRSKAEAGKLAAAKPWAVNAASFKEGKEAGALRARLRSSRYNAYVTEFTKDNVRWHRVRVGFYRTSKEAKSAAKTIGRKFKVKSAWVIKPSREEVTEHIR